MGIARKFLDWSKPALPAVVEYLAHRFCTESNTLDLDDVLLVLPGGRAARRLTELLVAYCEQHDLLLLPPEHCTVGRLPEFLYESRRPFANDLTQQLAWVQALKSADRVRCRRFIPQLPKDDDYVSWMDLGALLQRQHRELAADAIDFSQVAQRGSQLTGFEDESRWAFLRKVQQDYLRLLDDLQLWDLQTARLYAIDYHLCRTDKQIILVGTTDMNVAMRQMLDQVADQVTALIHAPRKMAKRFDQHGCLVPDQWTEIEIPIATDQIHVVEGPVEQAEEMVNCLAAFDGRYRADEVVIGVLDETLVPQLTRQLEESRIASRWVVGRTVRETAPYRLLAAVASLLDRGRYVDFAALVRHPDVSRWLTERVGTDRWLADLDDYYNEHLPPRLGQWPAEPSDGSTTTSAAPAAATRAPDASNKACASEPSPSSTAPLRQIATIIDEAVKPLRGPARPLTDWATAIAQLLATFYGSRTFQVDLPHDMYTLSSLEQIRSGLLQLGEIPQRIVPQLTSAQAINQIMAHAAGAQIPSPRDEGQLELLGWLELPLDTAPAVIVTGFNEGNVPTSVNSDLFLPNQLRQQLDLVDNRRRYARDAYALSVLQASREHLTLIAGRFTADHDPLAPSRLAFATDQETMAQRALTYFRAATADETSDMSIKPLDETLSVGGLVVPRPTPLSDPIKAISVTSFRTYLECPYRFYLQHVLRLAPIDDSAEELGPRAYGTLIHDVLSRFGQDTVRSSTDADAIDPFLQRTLDELVTAQLGNNRLPAVEVQIAQARHRLQAFAEWQAQRARDGWQIVHTETSGGDQPARLHLESGRSVDLHGRIDRIDRRGDQWAILDYKTGDAARSPQETHLRGGKWIDLQLPLYIHLADTLGIRGSIELGYILLPKETDKVGTSMAPWDAAMLAAADEIALQVASNIVDQRFWPPSRLVSGIVTDYASICQEHAYQPRLEDREQVYVLSGSHEAQGPHRVAREREEANRRSS
jgi:hypothetical protein